MEGKGDVRNLRRLLTGLNMEQPIYNRGGVDEEPQLVIVFKRNFSSHPDGYLELRRGSLLSSTITRDKSIRVALTIQQAL